MLAEITGNMVIYISILVFFITKADSSRILVTSGQGYCEHGICHKSEIINFESEDAPCQDWVDFPKRAAGATGALADILDLDFGAVQNNEVNELNRQYILDHQTLRPLRPSVESPTAAVQLNHLSTLTNPNQSNLPSTLPPSSSSNQVGNSTAAIPSSNSSTTSSSGSRRNSSLRKQPLQNTTTELQEKSAISASTLSNSSNADRTASGSTGDSSQAVLRDTKIEIAGKEKTHKIRKPKKNSCTIFLFDQSFVYFNSKIVDILLSRFASYWHCNM